MKKTLEKYGIGIFVRPPVFPEALGVTFDAQAPDGVLISREQESLIVDVPDGFVSDEAIRLSGNGHGRVNINIGRDAKVRVEENFAGQRDVMVAVRVAEGACAEYRSIQENADGFVVREAEVARDASLFWWDIVLGGDFTRSFASTKLVGENARTRVDAVFFGSGEQKFDLMHEAVHQASRTKSELRARGILLGKAKAVARGLARIEEGMLACVGSQRIDTLLLSDDAEVDVAPILEIANDEVSCAHGATVSRLDDAKLFYMMSRGMDHETATRAYLEAFLGIDDETLLTKVMEKL